MPTLQEMVRGCRLCPLYSSMPLGCSPVPGHGPVNAKLMFISESINEDEAVMQETLSGQSGQLLEKMLVKANISKEKVYRTAVVKCRPVSASGKTRVASKKEIRACKVWLNKELDIIRPKVVFTLGRIPLEVIWQKCDNLSEQVGRVLGPPFKEFYIIPLYHPSYLLGRSQKLIDKTIEYLKAGRIMSDVN